MKLAIADPPYLGRAVRWYGKNGCGDGYGKNQADNHPEAYLWDDPKTHIKLALELQKEYDGFAIAMSVHSLSTYLSVFATDSRNGIRIGSWVKPSAYPSGSRIGNYWEPVLFKIPKERRGRLEKGNNVKDVLSALPLRKNFVGSKPPEWTQWILDVLGYKDGDLVVDLFPGSGSVSEKIKQIEGSK